MEIKIIIVFIFCGFCNAGITSIDDIELLPVSVVGWRYAAVTPSDTKFGDTYPKLRFHYVLESPTSYANSSVTNEAVLFHSSKKMYFGISEYDQWCCTEKLFENGDCLLKDSIIADFPSLQLHSTGSNYLVNNGSDVFYWPRGVSERSVVEDQSIQLNISGVWYFIIADCKESNYSISIQGTVNFCNPFGYLSADLFPNIPVYLSLASAYFGLFIVWIVFLCIYWKNSVGVQRIITATILSGLVEGILWAAAWARYNDTGIINEPLNLIGALLTTVKLTFVRTLVLLVSLGYSVIFPTLDLCPKLGVITLTFLYGCVVAVSQYVEVLNQMGIYTPTPIRWSMLAFQVVLNGIYVIWIAYSLFIHMRSLKKSMGFDEMRMASSLKLHMYTCLSGFLGTFAVLSIICFSLELFFTQTTIKDSEWFLTWIFTAFWEIAYFFITLLIAFLWRPNSENLRFQFSEPYSELDETEPEPLHVQPPPPEYSQKEEPKSPLFMTHTIKKEDDDEGSEMDELVL